MTAGVIEKLTLMYCLPAWKTLPLISFIKTFSGNDHVVCLLFKAKPNFITVRTAADKHMYTKYIPVGHWCQMKVVMIAVTSQPKGQTGLVWPLLADSCERGPLPFHLRPLSPQIEQKLPRNFGRSRRLHLSQPLQLCERHFSSRHQSGTLFCGLPVCAFVKCLWDCVCVCVHLPTLLFCEWATSCFCTQMCPQSQLNLHILHTLRLRSGHLHSETDLMTSSEIPSWFSCFFSPHWSVLFSSEKWESLEREWNIPAWNFNRKLQISHLCWYC